MDLADLDRLSLLEDVHFAFDKADIRESDRAVLAKAVSYGSEVPLCGEHEESCWQRNRRAHMRIAGKAGGRKASKPASRDLGGRVRE